jgi:hypothetical protein
MKNRLNKVISKVISAGLGLMIASSTVLIVGFTGNASALACYQYDPNGFTTSSTPVFNNICGISGAGGSLSSSQGSYPLGDETNFVRIRPNTSGSPLGANNPRLTDNLDSACAAGDKFDIWTYIHNDAMPQFNDNGNGSAVAHDVRLATSAPVNTTGNNFTFGSTVSASNAASVSDTTSLKCNGQPVELTMVPESVTYNNNLSQTTFGNLSDSVVNGSTPIGSPGAMITGTQWGCWDYRVVVVYQVTVQPVPVHQTPSYMCTELGLTAEDNRSVKISKFTTTQANGASFSNAVIDWGDHATVTSASPVGQTHRYSENGTYTVTATAHFNVNGQDKTATSAGCTQKVTFSSNTPPTVTPPTTTTTTPVAPTALVNTGPGSVIGLFAATAIGGTAFYRRLLARRLSRQ